MKLKKEQMITVGVILIALILIASVAVVIMSNNDGNGNGNNNSNNNNGDGTNGDGGSQLTGNLDCYPLKSKLTKYQVKLGLNKFYRKSFPGYSDLSPSSSSILIN